MEKDLTRIVPCPKCSEDMELIDEKGELVAKCYNPKCEYYLGKFYDEIKERIKKEKEESPVLAELSRKYSFWGIVEDMKNYLSEEDYQKYVKEINDHIERKLRERDKGVNKLIGDVRCRIDNDNARLSIEYYYHRWFGDFSPILPISNAIFITKNANDIQNYIDDLIGYENFKIYQSKNSKNKKEVN